MSTRKTAPVVEESKPVETSGVYFEEVEVDAKIAAYWLERNAENNRNAKQARINKYARDMAHGRWLITGDAVKITEDELMIDGGQRMRAVVRAHNEYPHFTSVRMIFARNVPYDAMLVTDTGASRTFADALKIADAVNQTQCGAIVRRVHVWKQGNPAYFRGTNSGFVDPTMSELLDLYRSDPRQFDAAALRGMDVRGQRIGNATAAGTIYYVLNQIDHDAANNFFDNLIAGTGMEGSNPVWVLRERLRRAASRLDRSDYLTVTEQAYFYVKAWNAYLADEPMSKLQLPERREITNLNFPTPRRP